MTLKLKTTHGLSLPSFFFFCLSLSSLRYYFYWDSQEYTTLGGNGLSLHLIDLQGASLSHIISSVFELSLRVGNVSVYIRYNFIPKLGALGYDLLLTNDTVRPPPFPLKAFFARQKALG